MDARMVFNSAALAADLDFQSGALALDGGLETAVIVSLFTDRRADVDDELPDGTTRRRGWWGDAVAPVVDGAPVLGDRIGSRLWLLAREKQTQSVVLRARDYAREALQWLIDDGIAERIDILAETIRPGVLALAIDIHRPAGDALDFRFDYVWQSQAEQER
ncbi:MAG: hypothetical protein COA65_08845 [Rhodospirillaceae bacterium]|nr:MAG: hypothetical protein COA65_08845 [Rhodospirillaceae bacterium]